MRKFCQLAVILMCFAGVAKAQPAREADRCYDANVFLMVWEAQGWISHIDQNGSNIRVIVGRQAWLRTRLDVRERIALAAYCRVSHSDGGGRVEIATFEGLLFGSVTEGRWRDRFAGD